jgi:FkbH-like protein
LSKEKYKRKGMKSMATKSINEEYQHVLDNLSKIKVVIWDLDDTFWRGTISEEDIVPIQENIELVKLLVDKGIMNSICSKNDREVAMKKLEELGVRDYFVFDSINWEPKGNRIKDTIERMQLRAPNILFLDDNEININETKFYTPEILTATPGIIPTLYDAVKGLDKTDKEHARLKQYKILERKKTELDNVSTNEEFLYNSNIKLEVRTDCMSKLDRIHELILRTNQLNYTKKRSSREELQALIYDENIKTGYITVSDKFGDYGIVGFYALSQESLIHFAFSCRTLGMGIEQYVYANLNFPTLEVVGEVSTSLNKTEVPGWINMESSNLQGKKEKESTSISKEFNILFNGPCDLEMMLPYVSGSEEFICEFTYVSPDNGVKIAQRNHTLHIVQSLTLTNEEKQNIIGETIFSDKEMFSTDIFQKGENINNIIFLSTLVDSNFGIYRHKKTGNYVTFGEYYYPLTDPNNWELYIKGEIENANCKFTREFLESFSEKYEFIGRTSEEMLLDNLIFIRKHLEPSQELVLMLGVELEYKGELEPAYIDRSAHHKKMNAIIRKFAEKHDNVSIIDYNNYVKEQNDFREHYNHYTKIVYYKMAQDVVKIINSYKPNSAQSISFNQVKKDRFIEVTKDYVKKTFPVLVNLRNKIK